MMFNRSNQKKKVSISTSSLPDIVFMMLFFFMVVTVLRSTEVNHEMHLPVVLKAQADVHQSNEIAIYLFSQTEIDGLQINNKMITLEEVDHELNMLTSGMSTFDKKQTKVYLFADKKTKMQLVNSIKKSLQKCGLISLNYVSLSNEN